MTHVPEICLAIGVLFVVAFLTLHRESRTPPISAEPPRRTGALTTTHSTSLPANEAGTVRGAPR